MSISLHKSRVLLWFSVLTGDTKCPPTAQIARIPMGSVFYFGDFVFFLGRHPPRGGRASGQCIELSFAHRILKIVRSKKDACELDLQLIWGEGHARPTSKIGVLNEN
jgi:hypothetical protein